MRKNRIITSLIGLALAGTMAFAEETVKVGIIGLDTSHSKEFTRILNTNDPKTPLAVEFEVVAAYPYGTRTIESAARRIPEYIEAVKGYGVEICSSIAELLEKVDVVLLETNDGRLHLEQAAEVFKSGKICYIDKPLGATLAETIAICRLAELYGAPVFSASALRYSPETIKIAAGEYGPVLGAECVSPHIPEPTHPDFGYYGIHGVETLYTILGTGCVSVSRSSSESTELVTGIWSDGRIGCFRALVGGPWHYGGIVYTKNGLVQAGGYPGYEVLLDEILLYFKTGVSPVSAEEIIEEFAFMEASNMSKSRGGVPVSIAEAMKIGEEEAEKLLSAYTSEPKLRELTVIDPGHFHAALVQKYPLEGVGNTVHVYAPKGEELTQYLAYVDSFNSRAEQPSCWVEDVNITKSPSKALAESDGGVAVIAGNNRNKTEYIHTALTKGYNVLSDKPMAIDKKGYELLSESYRLAQEKGLVIYELMTERYDIVNILTRTLLSDNNLFGEFDLSAGPAVKMKSVHHFYKEVNGTAAKRPLWYYDTAQQGEGIADVTTHLIDLVFWQCFPEKEISPEDVNVSSANHYPTVISLEEYGKSTGAKAFPKYLKKNVHDGKLYCDANGSIDFNVFSLPVSIDVVWEFEGDMDSFSAEYHGTKASIKVVQNPGEAKNIFVSCDDYEAVASAFAAIQEKYPSVGIVYVGVSEYKIVVPQELRAGHEDHFSMVTSKFLKCLDCSGELPFWEYSNSLAKYKIISEAVELSRK